VLGTVEILGLVANELRLGEFSGSSAGFNFNAAGFVIARFFVVWFAALAIWRFGHFEERWGLRRRSLTGRTRLGRA
jgi:high-affinity nickel-transport protein